MKIVAAAILYEGRLYTLPQPARHSHVIGVIWHEIKKQVAGETQGFVTDEGKFVDRKEALRIATEAGQITEPSGLPELYSEDLW